MQQQRRRCPLRRSGSVTATGHRLIHSITLEDVNPMPALHRSGANEQALKRVAAFFPIS